MSKRGAWMRPICGPVVVVACWVGLLRASAFAQSAHDDPPQAQLLHALQHLIDARSLTQKDFVEQYVDASLVEREGADVILQRLSALCDAVADFELSMLAPVGDDSVIAGFDAPMGGPGVAIKGQLVPGRARIGDLWIEGGPSLSGKVYEDAYADLPALTWNNLNERLEWEAEQGFAGAVLIVRNGEIVLDRGYGMANEAEGIANKPDTIFAIGSTPIDFTHAAALLLIHQGKLSFDDPISKFFENAPTDKRMMTVGHLMNSESGLQDFLDLPTDVDPDHMWVDRDEAVRRALAQELMFPPGQGKAHSHAAWGLVAAIVEIVSGETYPDFVRKHLFDPAGMHDTGFFGEQTPVERAAVGYGVDSDGAINAPPYWGRTSWLVMGTGGQVSTTHDMLKWIRFVRDGGVLSEGDARRLFPQGVALSGGDSYGFEIVYTTNPDTMMIIISNNVDAERRRHFNGLARALVQLVNAPRVSLGVALGIEESGRIVITQVAPGSPAEGAGLQVDDVLVSMGGVPVDGDNLRELLTTLRAGQSVSIVVRRHEAERTLSVTPRARE
ncbi:MAG: serine hydrolase [Phycisphaerales bacterium]|nr:serine hydrolase [Phycisphaerales bacterium]